jgi:hypothetical protein
MSLWPPRAQETVDLPRDAVASYVRAQFGHGLRRAGISAEFTLAGAVACWRRLPTEPEAPSLALVWTSATFPGTENAQCLAELLGAGNLPMPFQFVASQPHMVAAHAQPWLPGLAQVITLLGSGAEVEESLLAGLCLRQPWTHVLLGEVWTPGPAQPDGDRFKAVWRILERREPCPAAPDHP